MSSPQNGTQTTTSSTPNASLNYIDSLLGGTKWGGNVGSGVTLTYSFPWSNFSSAYWASTPYYTPNDEPSDAYGLSTMEQAATRNTLAAWANVANLNFSEITETSSNVGDLRFTWTNKTDTVTAGGPAAGWAWYPNDYWASGGDVWLSAPSMAGDPASSWQAGGSSYNTLTHEIGHALGLKHPFGEGTTLPSSQDSEQYSVMSYTSYSDNFFRKVTANPDGTYSQNSFSYSSILPSTPMLYDIAAIQYMYGANMSHRTGDDVYTFDPNTPFYQTIWDAGGNDTISISNFSRGSKIDLRAGDYSTISFLSDPMPQGWTTTTVVTYTGNNNLAIAYGAVIENAIGGSGDDTLQGNSVNNSLNGGLGSDTAIFNGNKSSYNITKSGNTYTVTSLAEGIDTLTNIEFLRFQDGTYGIDSILQTITNNNAPTGNVTISGTTTQGQTLTASNSLADLDGLGAISYQWLSGGNVISGATQSTYILTATDVGKTMSVKASYTDLLGTAESMTSSTTALVSSSQNTATPIGSAKVILSNKTFTISDNDVNVIGGSGGNEIIKIQSGVSNINFDANIERIELSGSLSTYKFIAVSGIGVEIWNASSKIATIPSLNQDTKIAFSNGTAILRQTGAADFQLGNSAISSTTATTPSNVVLDSSDLSTVGTSSSLTGSITINATNLIGTGTTGVDTFNIATGTYSATINGFSTGDKLSFFAGASISVTSDTNQADGIQMLTASDPGTGATATITLTGLTSTQDASVFNVNSFNTVFGAGTII